MNLHHSYCMPPKNSNIISTFYLVRDLRHFSFLCIHNAASFQQFLTFFAYIRLEIVSNSYLDLIFVIGFSWCGREVFFFLWYGRKIRYLRIGALEIGVVAKVQKQVLLVQKQVLLQRIGGFGPRVLPYKKREDSQKNMNWIREDSQKNMDWVFPKNSFECLFIFM